MIQAELNQPPSRFFLLSEISVHLMFKERGRFPVRAWTTIIIQFENPDVAMIDHVITDSAYIKYGHNTFILRFSPFSGFVRTVEKILKLGDGQKGELEPSGDII